MGVCVAPNATVSYLALPTYVSALLCIRCTYHEEICDTGPRRAGKSAEIAYLAAAETKLQRPGVFGKPSGRTPPIPPTGRSFPGSQYT